MLDLRSGWFWMGLFLSSVPSEGLLVGLSGEGAPEASGLPRLGGLRWECSIRGQDVGVSELPPVLGMVLSIPPLKGDRLCLLAQRGPGTKSPHSHFGAVEGSELAGRLGEAASRDLH